jgi:flotillin
LVDLPASVKIKCNRIFQIAAEIADPLAECGKITMVSTGNGEIGASRLTGEVTTFYS